MIDQLDIGSNKKEQGRSDRKEMVSDDRDLTARRLHPITATHKLFWEPVRKSEAHFQFMQNVRVEHNL